jgi:hypothetical protein
MLMFASASSLQAQSPYPEHSVKSAFIYRMASYIDWPPESLNTAQFTFTVFGADEIAAELQQLVSKYTVKDLPVRVQRATSVKELADAQVVFVGARYEGSLLRLEEKIGNRPVLLITDQPNGLEQGSMINFISVDRRVRFEVSVTAAERAGLTVGSELLAVAARVRGAGEARESCAASAPCANHKPRAEGQNVRR